MMRFLFNPDDALARHPALCMALLFGLLLIEGALLHG